MKKYILSETNVIKIAELLNIHLLKATDLKEIITDKSYLKMYMEDNNLQIIYKQDRILDLFYVISFMFKGKTMYNYCIEREIVFYYIMIHEYYIVYYPTKKRIYLIDSIKEFIHSMK